MKLHLVSLGCAKNLVDSEGMLGRLIPSGCSITPNPEEAEVISINTCSFIEPAINESIDTILELAKYADFHFTSEENIARSLSLPGISKHRELHRELLEQFTNYSTKLVSGEMSYKDFFQFLIEWLVGHTFYEDQELFNNNK